MIKIINVWNKIIQGRKGRAVFFLLSFLIWGFLFRGFLFSRLALVNDAVSYYDHIKFYIENLAQGVYPQWDPYWNDGAPNEFFLRRMGSYNPFFLIILFLYKIGIPYQSAYLIFLFFYYFLGVTGFYCLCQQIFRNTFVSMSAYLLLMFSSLGTMLFSSFIIFLFTPIVWFFYFLLSFGEKPERLSFSGLIFCLMLIAITYIPFYFLTFFLLFLFCYSIVYASSFIAVFRRFLDFFKKETFFVFIGMILLFFAIIPGAVFMMEARNGEFVLPERHYGIDHDNMLAVNEQKIIQGGIIGAESFHCLFTNWKDFKPGLFYLPVMSYVLLLLAGLVRISRRLIVLVLIGGLLFLIGLYEATPVYPFLYKYIPFFKYFRNFQFFRWVFLLPLFILVCSEQLRLFLTQSPASPQLQKGRMIYWILIHLALILFFYIHQADLFVTFISLAVSLVLGLVYIALPAIRHRWVMAVCFLILLIAHPVFVFARVPQNAQKLLKPYAYDFNMNRFHFKRADWSQTAALSRKDLKGSGQGLQYSRKVGHDVYYVSSTYNTLLRSVPYDIFAGYRQNKFILYDRVQWTEDHQKVMAPLVQALAQNKNMAYVSVAQALGKGNVIKDGGVSPHADIVRKPSDRFKLISFNANRVELKTNFDVRRFLIYNDNFHSGWQAFINDEKVPLFRANFSFKGLWLPPGPNKVVFQFGTPAPNYLHFVYIAMYGLCLLYLIVLGMKKIEIIN